MKRFALNVNDKKTLLNRLQELTEVKPRYTFMPRCAYECGPYTVEKNGDLVAEDDADATILQILLGEGLVTGTLEAAEEAEKETVDTESPENTAEADAPEGLTVSLPMAGHSVSSLRRLINLVYSRGPLLSKSTGGAFGVDKALLAALEEGNIVKTEDLIAKVQEHGGLTGLAFDDGVVSFTGFPLTDDPNRTRAFTQLASLMNRHAIGMKRIQAKEVNDENEKYAFRIWLQRIGMNSNEFKNSRKVLMQNLSGNAAFRTKAEEENWKARQQAKRDELRAAKATNQAVETDTDTAAEALVDVADDIHDESPATVSA